MQFDLRSVGPGLWLSTAALLLLGFACFCGMVGLRFARRGAARFWMGPAVTALALLPAAVGTAFAASALGQVLEGAALTGSGGVAALAAGSAESFLPLLTGLASMAGLSLVGVLLVALGTSRGGEGTPGGTSALLWLSLPAIVVLAGVAALLVSIVGDVNAGVGAGPLDPSGLLLRWRLAFFGSAGLSLLLVGLAVAAVRSAPRGNAPVAVKLVPALCLSAALVGGIVGCALVYGRIDGLMQTAMTGLRPGEARTPQREELAPPTTDLGAERGVPTLGEPIRIGGAIESPRRLKNVAPVYPELAKQARVQGVVVLECTISPEGQVTAVKVLRGIPLLDEAAVAAVRQWVYTPTVLNGVAVPVIMTVTVNFKIS
jgi:protein TonB